MNKTDMVPDDVLDEIESVAERLGPRAKRIRRATPRSTLTRCSTPDGSTSRRPRGRRGGSARLRKARANTVTSQQPASTNTITPRAPPRPRRRLVRLPLGRRPRSRVVRELAPRLGRRDCAGEGCRQRRGDGRGHRRESGRSLGAGGTDRRVGARRRPPHATRVHRQRDGRSADPRRARRTGGVEPPESVENADAFPL